VSNGRALWPIGARVEVVRDVVSNVIIVGSFLFGKSLVVFVVFEEGSTELLHLLQL